MQYLISFVLLVNVAFSSNWNPIKDIADTLRNGPFPSGRMDGRVITQIDIQSNNYLPGKFCAREGNDNYCLCGGTVRYGWFSGAENYLPGSQMWGQTFVRQDNVDLSRCNNDNFGDPRKGQSKDCTCDDSGDQNNWLTGLRIRLAGSHEGSAGVHNGRCLHWKEAQNEGRIELRECEWAYETIPYNGGAYSMRKGIDKQSWDYNGYTGRIRAHGTNFCLDAHDRNSNGKYVHLYTCSDTNENQDWLISITQAGANTWGLVKNRYTNKCLEANELENGADVTIWDCPSNKWAHSQWDWGAFANGNVPVVEGDHLGNFRYNDLDHCKNWCNSQGGRCQSFAMCPDNHNCWFKKKVQTSRKQYRNIHRCTTHFKINHNYNWNIDFIGSQVWNAHKSGNTNARYQKIDAHGNSWNLYPGENYYKSCFDSACDDSTAKSEAETLKADKMVMSVSNFHLRFLTETLAFVGLIGTGVLIFRVCKQTKPEYEKIESKI